MSDNNQKTTIYLKPQVKKFIRLKAVAEDRSMSDIINDYFSDMLENLSDVKEINRRRKEASTSLEDLLQDLGITHEKFRG